jgi:hypothetical protein
MTYDDDPDPWVKLWEGPTFEAEHLRLRLEQAHIPVEYGDALLPGQARVQIPRSYLGEARDVIEGVEANWPVLTAHTEDGFDLKPTWRLAFIVMAAVLLIVIVVASI